MAAYESIAALKDAVTAAIYQNAAGLITAEDLQETLHDIIDTLNILGGSGEGGGAGVVDGMLPFTLAGVKYREGIRETAFVLDKAITELGFDGEEDTDWVNVRSEDI